MEIYNDILGAIKVELINYINLIVESVLLS
jgi:hypothetical protein